MGLAPARGRVSLSHAKVRDVDVVDACRGRPTEPWLPGDAGLSSLGRAMTPASLRHAPPPVSQGTLRRIFRRWDNPHERALAVRVALVLLMCEAVLCGLIIWKVPYTEARFLGRRAHN